MSLSTLFYNTNNLCVLKLDIINKILESKNPDVALLYLYIARDPKGFEVKKAIKDLEFTKPRLDSAYYELSLLNTSKPESIKTESISYIEKPKYKSSELRDAREDTRFSALCDTAETIIGKVLTDSYIKTLLYIYDKLKLPAEVIVELLVYLKDKNGTNIKKMDIEREAHLWVDMGIATYTDATNYIASKCAEKPLFDSMMQALKVYGRAASPIEERYILSFIHNGFTPEVVSLAVERMQNAIGKFSFQYLNKILLRFKEQNLTTVDEIIASDPNFSNANNTPSTPKGELEDWELEWLKEFK